MWYLLSTAQLKVSKFLYETVPNSDKPAVAKVTKINRLLPNSCCYTNDICVVPNPKKCAITELS